MVDVLYKWSKGKERGDEEELATPELRKSKRVASKKEKGKVMAVYSKEPRKTRGIEKLDLPQLDDVPRKKRKLLETSSGAASKAKVGFHFKFYKFLFFISPFPDLFKSSSFILCLGC